MDLVNQVVALVDAVEDEMHVVAVEVLNLKDEAVAGVDLLVAYIQTVDVFLVEVVDNENLTFLDDREKDEMA